MSDFITGKYQDPNPMICLNIEVTKDGQIVFERLNGAT